VDIAVFCLDIGFWFQALWWLTPVIPAAQEAEIGGSQSEAGLNKTLRHHLKRNQSKKKPGSGSSGRASGDPDFKPQNCQKPNSPRQNYYFRCKETKAQRGKVVCPRSHSRERTEVGPEPRRVSGWSGVCLVISVLESSQLWDPVCPQPQLLTWEQVLCDPAHLVGSLAWVWGQGSWDHVLCCPERTWGRGNTVTQS
jgi:hypothetical protein